MAGTLISWEVRVRGRVQGVYYRAFTRDTADRLGVCGWVRNEPDGSVTALLQHSDAVVLRRMIALMQQGPPGSRVELLEHNEVRGIVDCMGFTIQR